RLVLEYGEITYDYVFSALCYESNTFCIKGMEENSFAIVDIDSSRLIREHLELQFAKYASEENASEDLLNILVGGAGFTGIELLGELAERVQELCKKYDIDRSKVRIINV